MRTVRIGYIKLSDEYVIEFENGKYKLIRIGRGWVPASSNYPIDPRLEWEGDKVILETDNVDKLITKIEGLILSSIDLYERELVKFGDNEYWFNYIKSRINQFYNLLSRINEIKDAILNKKSFQWESYPYKITIQ